MKFINYLSSITGIGVFPLIALILFTVIFLVVIYSTFTASKITIAEKANIPLDENVVYED